MAYFCGAFILNFLVCGTRHGHGILSPRPPESRIWESPSVGGAFGTPYRPWLARFAWLVRRWPSGFRAPSNLRSRYHDPDCCVNWPWDSRRRRPRGCLSGVRHLEGRVAVLA